MSDICILYNADDVADFATFFKDLFQKGSPDTEVIFKPIEEIKDLTDLSVFKVLVLLCSPLMIEFFDNEAETKQFQVCFTNHPCLVCLQYYVDDDEISCLKSALSIPTGWKLFTRLETKQECTETIGSIIDILEEQSTCRLPPRPPKSTEKKARPKRPSKRPVKLVPNAVHKANEEVAVIFQKAPSGTVQVSFREFDKIVDLKQYNDTTYLLRVPPLPKQGQVRVVILCNNDIVTELSLKIVKPNLAAFECLGYLSQILCVDAGDRQSLDTKLVGLFDKSVPSDGTLSELLKIHTQDMPFQNLIESDQEVPTLLHFAAKHGLEDLTCAIMDTPGSSAAFQIENKDGLDPADLAEINGFVDLAEHMRTQFETHTMVEYIHLVANDNLYLNQEELEQSQKQRSERSQSLKVKPTEAKVVPDHKFTTLPRRAPPPPPPEEKVCPKMAPEEFMGITPSSEPKAISAFGSTTHDELIEIGNAVRAGEFTVEEAERLYASWVDRNKSGQSKSLRERNDAIEELRNQYQTVFKPQKERQSVLSKIKQKVAPRKRPKDDDGNYTMHIIHPLPARNYQGRTSTISNSSSSSSGSRGSTVSQESWRDSNIGSMQEESDSSDGGIDPTPVYDVQRRSSDSTDAQRNQNAELRKSMKDQFFDRMKVIEEKSPDLPPRPPPKRSLPALPTHDSPRPAERKTPNADRPPLPLPQNPESPLSKRPPLPIPGSSPSPPAVTNRRPPPPPKKKS